MLADSSVESGSDTIASLESEPVPISSRFLLSFFLELELACRSFEVDGSSAFAGRFPNVWIFKRSSKASKNSLEATVSVLII